METQSHQWTRADDATILEHAGRWSFAEIGRKLGDLSKNHVRGRYLRLMTWMEDCHVPTNLTKPQRYKAFLDHLHDNSSPAEEISATADADETVSVDATKDSQVVTVSKVIAKNQEAAVDVAIEQAGFDQQVWMISRMKVKRYEGFFRSRSYQANPKKKNDWRREATRVAMWSVQLWLERKSPTVQEDMVDWGRAVIAEMKRYAPVVPALTYPVITGRKMMAVISMPDLHAGKLAWRPESGDNYDAKEAKAVFLDALGYCLAEVRSKSITEIVLPLGSDFFHTDNAEGTTTAGTRQDTDTRWQKVFLDMKHTVIDGIMQCRQIAPVFVKILPGNHDYNKSFFFGDTLASWFHDTGNVAVDNNPFPRKYHLFGTSLIGWTHGDQEKSDDLPVTMALEVPDLWAKAKHREIHTGHYHKIAKKEISGRTSRIFKSAEGAVVDFASERSMDENTINSVVWRSLPSLSATDAWHARRGYVKGPRAAQCYLYDRDYGYAGHVNYAYWGQKAA